MKTYHILLTLFLLGVSSFCTSLFAQEKVSLNIEYPGTVQKALKKINNTNIKALTISGNINNRDLSTIYSITTLDSLNLYDATFSTLSDSINKLSSYSSVSIPSSEFWFDEASSINNLILPKETNVIRLVNPSINKTLISLVSHKPISVRGGRLSIYDYKIEDISGSSLNFSQNWDANIIRIAKKGPKSLSPKDSYYRSNFFTGRYLSESFHRSDIDTVFYSFALVVPDIDFVTVEHPFESAILLAGAQNFYSIIHYNLTDESETNVVLSKAIKGIIPKVNNIEPYAFNNCNWIQSIDLRVDSLEYIGPYTFAGTSITKLTIPENIKQISPLAFDESNITDVTFESKYPPILADRYDIDTNNPKFRGNISIAHSSQIKNCSFHIPPGSFDNYNMGNWRQLHIIDSSQSSSMTITVKEAGTLKDYIPKDKAPFITTLVIKGFLNETDFDCIKLCNNLESLDLSYCYTTYSEGKIKKLAQSQMVENALIGEIFKIAGQQAEHNYEIGKGTLVDAIGTSMAEKYINSLVEEENSKLQNITAVKSCLLESNCLEGLDNLRYFAYPLQLRYADVYIPKNVKSVKLPAAPEFFGGWRYDGMEIKLPESIKEVGSFWYTHLKTLDLRDTQIEELNGLFKFSKEDLPACDVFYAPKKLKCITEEPNMRCSIKTFKKSYFYTREKPNGLNLYSYRANIEVHIPRGCKAGWVTEDIGDTVVIDDIDL